jgi:hypothetical protein
MLGPAIQYPRATHQIYFYMFVPDRHLVPSPPDLKKYRPCILEGRLSTTHILNALHLEGPKFNVYVHFFLVNNQLIPRGG